MFVCYWRLIAPPSAQGHLRAFTKQNKKKNKNKKKEKKKKKKKKNKKKKKGEEEEEKKKTKEDKNEEEKHIYLFIEGLWSSMLTAHGHLRAFHWFKPDTSQITNTSRQMITYATTANIQHISKNSIPGIALVYNSI